MTCCQPIGNGQNQSLQAMDMTTNYEGWELEQSTVLSSKFSVANKVGISGPYRYCRIQTL